MRTVLIPIFALGLIIGVLFVTAGQFKEPPPGIGPGGDRVLVIYDVTTPAQSEAEQMVSPLSIVQLLAHFDVSIQTVSTADYKKGQLSEYAFGVYVGTKNEQPLPSYFLDDIFDTHRPFMWIGANLDRLADRHSMDPYGFKLDDPEDRFATNEVDYKGQRLAKVDLKTFKVDVTRADRVNVIAEAKFVTDPLKPAVSLLDDVPGTPARMAVEAVQADAPLPQGLPPLPADLAAEDSRLPAEPATAPIPAMPAPPPPPSPNPIPWMIRSDQFWYVASDPIAYHVEGGAYLAFADALYDFLGQKNDDSPKAFVRLEDVHPKRELDSLKKAADFLFSRNVPFAFTLIPVYKNPATDETIYMSESPEFLATVRYLISKGGTPILHGFTHQSTGESAVDFEFWNGETGGHPISLDDKTFARSRVEQALNECFQSDIYPLAWTTPHYAAGQIDYDAFAEFFTTVVERRMPVELYGSDQFFPYVIKSDMHKQMIVPESLGYVNPAAGRDVAALLRDADALKVVRGAWASFFYHTFLDPQLLVDLVDGLQKRGFEFVALSSLNNKVTTKSRVIVSGVNEVKMTLDAQYRRERTFDIYGEMLDENYSFSTVKGDVESLVTLRNDEVQVIEGVYSRPDISIANLHLFRPTISGVTNPVAVVLLFTGMFTLLVFLTIWIYLITRRTLSGAKHLVAARHQDEV